MIDQNHCFVETAVFHQLVRGLDQGMPKADGPKEGRDQYQGDGRADGNTTNALHVFHDHLRAYPEANKQHCDDDGNIDKYMLDLPTHEAGHAHLLTTLHLDATVVALQMVEPSLGEMPAQPLVGRKRRLDGVWRDEGRDDGYRNDDGIQELVDDTVTQAQRGNDEGKLTNLAEAEAALYGLLKA